ncbi:MAG TPA: hypothetical protein VEL75_04565 [Candidatus Methylomirabilis sp.]|nr:hypothetical protein [Candidatus Methylomirabilis sp.]
MRPGRASSPTPRPAASGTPPPEAPELPTNKAFVLQLSRETGPRLEPFAGRLEHLATGRRLRFESIAAFQEAMTRLLGETRPRRGEDG